MWVLETTPRNSAGIARVPLENNIMDYLIYTTFEYSVFFFSLLSDPPHLPTHSFFSSLPPSFSLIFPVSQLSPVGVSQILLWGQPSSEVNLTGSHLKRNPFFFQKLSIAKSYWERGETACPVLPIPCRDSVSLRVWTVRTVTLTLRSHGDLPCLLMSFTSSGPSVFLPVTSLQPFRLNSRVVMQIVHSSWEFQSLILCLLTNCGSV